jgi:hypothetical protein
MCRVRGEVQTKFCVESLKGGQKWRSGQLGIMLGRAGHVWFAMSDVIAFIMLFFFCWYHY